MPLFPSFTPAEQAFIQELMGRVTTSEGDIIPMTHEEWGQHVQAVTQHVRECFGPDFSPNTHEYKSPFNKQ